MPQNTKILLGIMLLSVSFATFVTIVSYFSSSKQTARHPEIAVVGSKVGTLGISSNLTRVAQGQEVEVLVKLETSGEDLSSVMANLIWNDADFSLSSTSPRFRDPSNNLYPFLSVDRGVENGKFDLTLIHYQPTSSGGMKLAANTSTNIFSVKLTAKTNYPTSTINLVTDNDKSHILFTNTTEDGMNTGTMTQTAITFLPMETPSCILAVSPTEGTTGSTSYTFTPTASGGNGTYAYSWSNPDGTVTSGISSTLTSKYNTATSGTNNTATLTITSGGVSSTCSKQAIVKYPAPSCILAVSPTEGTTGSTSYTFTPTASGGNGTYAYSWSNPDGTVTSGISSTLTSKYNTATSGTNNTATLTITSGGVSSTCSKQAIVKYPAPSCILAVSPTEGTTGSTSYTFTPTASGGNGTYAYSWSNPDGTVTSGISSTLTSKYNTATSGTNNTATLTITSGGVSSTCSKQAIVKYPAPSCILAVSPTEGTTGSTSYTFTPTASGGNGTYAYSWSNPDGTVTSGISSTLTSKYNTATSGTNNTATLTITSGGVSSTCSKQAIVKYPAPSCILAVSPTEGTTGSTSYTFTPTASGGNGTYAYSWSNPDGTVTSGISSTLTSKYNTATSGTNNTATLTITSGGVSSTCSKQAIVKYPAPSCILAVSPTEGTTGSTSYTFTPTASGGNGTYAYSWSNPDGTVTSGISSTLTSKYNTATSGTNNTATLTITSGGVSSTCSKQAIVKLPQICSPNSTQCTPELKVKVCNADGTEWGTAADCTGKGELCLTDKCAVKPGDINLDKSVNTTDLIEVIRLWNNPYGISDLLLVLNNFGK
jgi:hypothetical protein